MRLGLELLIGWIIGIDLESILDNGVDDLWWWMAILTVGILASAHQIVLTINMSRWVHCIDWAIMESYSYIIEAYNSFTIGGLLEYDRL